MNESFVPVADATGEHVQAIWTFENDLGTVILIEPIGGPKRYRRVWLSQPALSDDWTWHKPDDAVRIA